MPDMNGSFYFFDDVCVDAKNFRVTKSGEPLTLTPRAFDVLLFLINHAPTVVEKKDLFDQIWIDTAVSDNALTKIIKEIRHVLNDDANNPRYIETIHRRGYRFMCAIEKSNELQSIPITSAQEPVDLAKPVPSPVRPGVRIWSRSKILLVLLIAVSVSIAVFVAWRFSRAKPKWTPEQIHSIAVLPFKPLNSESRDESLEMGMAESLITRLSNLRQVAVRPMTAVSKYVDTQDPLKAGLESQADAVLDGSIQKAGERVRVSVRLLRVRDGASIWSEQFDENFTDIFKVQDSIASRITNALALQLSGSEQEQLAKHYTNDPEAYQLYSRAQLIWHSRRPRWIRESLEYYQQAVARDPKFALAYIGIADCYISMSGQHRITMQEAEANARPNIMTALAIDDSLAQAHNAFAELKYQYEYDWDGAEKEFNTAIGLNPNVPWIRQAYGWFLMSEGRFDEATTQMETALKLDPNSLTIRVGRGRLFYYSRQYDAALKEFQNLAAVEPNDFSLYFSLFTIYEQKQMYPEALEAIMHGAPADKIEAMKTVVKQSGWAGLWRSRLVRLQEQAKKEPIRPSEFVDIYARLDQKDEAFAYLEKALEQHEPMMLQFKVEPAYDNLRSDPRYGVLLQKIGLHP